METESTDKLTPYKTDLEYLDDHFQVRDRKGSKMLAWGLLVTGCGRIILQGIESFLIRVS